MDAALAGDLQAASLLLSRTLPTLKPQAERVRFEYDPESAKLDQLNSVLNAVAEGELSVEAAKIFLDALSMSSMARQYDTTTRYDVKR